jgi:hypothetical protein
MYNKVLMGYIAVDSGQVMICDPCYIDSDWEKEDFEDLRVYENTITKERLQYRLDFPRYDVIIPKYGLSMNDLLKTKDWAEVQNIKEAQNSFSYNACAKATLSGNGFGELRFKRGHTGAGIALRTPYGDGMYAVYGNYNEENVLVSVIIDFAE